MDSMCLFHLACDDGSDDCSNYSRFKAILLVVGTTALAGGLEALLILTLRVCFPFHFISGSI